MIVMKIVFNTSYKYMLIITVVNTSYLQLYGARLMIKNHLDNLIGKCDRYDNWETGNRINVSISINGSDTPVTRPETDKAGQSSRDSL